MHLVMKQKSLFVSHWIILSTDSFKNTDPFRNETEVFIPTETFFQSIHLKALINWGTNHH